jgi:hypothetical protein
MTNTAQFSNNEYQKDRDTVENRALSLLEIEGKSLKAGEILRYVITDYEHHYNKNKQSSGNMGAIPIELIDDEGTTTAATYDVRRYMQLLQKHVIQLEPFGILLHNNNMTKLQC